MYRFRLLFPWVVFCAGLTGVCAASAPEARARRALRELPLQFEANAGQWKSDVRFAGRAADSTVMLKSSGAVMATPAGSVGLRLRGSNPRPRIEGTDLASTRANYFKGARKEDWRTGVKRYGRVRYSQVYPGIDMVYYGSGSHLEYDFVLAPGADASRIRLEFRGARAVSLTADGELEVETSGGRLVQKRPYIYQGTQQVGGRYKLLGRNAAGIELDAYDRSRTLTIDPVISYASLLGGTGTDNVAAVRVDKNGMLWVAGAIGNNDLVGTDNTFQAASKGSNDAFLAEFDPVGGSLLYFTYIGGTDADAATDLALDNNGNVFLTGTTLSTDFPQAGTAVQAANNGGGDGWVMQLVPSSGGTDALWYSSYIGGKGEDDPTGIALDGSGNVYLVGTTFSEDFPLTSSAYQNARWGNTDAFVAAINLNSGTLLYSSYLGGETYDTGTAIAVTPGGKVYLAGSTESIYFPMIGDGFRRIPQGSVDGWLAQMDLTQANDASLVYSTYFGGDDWDEVRKIALDPSGKLLVTGFTLSSDFPVTANAFQSAPSAAGDAFVARMDLTASPREKQLLYGTYLGGSDGDAGLNVAGDAAGNIFVTGYTQSADFPASPNALQPAWGKGVDAFVSQFGPDGRLVYSSYLGATGVNVGYAMALGNDGSLYIGGAMAQHNIDLTPNAAQSSFGGGLSDGFVVVMAPQ